MKSLVTDTSLTQPEFTYNSAWRSFTKHFERIQSSNKQVILTLSLSIYIYIYNIYIYIIYVYNL